MITDEVELMNLFDYILFNKSILIDDNEIFSRDTLIKIRDCIKNQEGFELSKEQENLLISNFIINNNTFDEYTPNLFLLNKECINVSLNNNFSSIDLLKKIPSEIIDDIESFVIPNKYILNENSPTVLKRNFIVANNSIDINPSSADYIEWEYIPQKELLINKLAEMGYVLSKNSPKVLTTNKKIVLNSVKKDVHSLVYANEITAKDKDIFVYSFMNGYSYNIQYVWNRPLSYFIDPSVLKKAFSYNNGEIYGSSDKRYIENFDKLYSDAINSLPTLKTFDNVFRSIALESWKEYRIKNDIKFGNLHGKICSQFRKHKFAIAIKSLPILMDMEIVLENKYIDLYKAIEKYYNVYHSDIPNKFSELGKFRDIIAKMCALYISKSKEKYIKEEMDKYYKYIRRYFKVNLSHPYIKSKAVETKKKKKLKSAYKNGEKWIIDFIDIIVDKYSSELDDKTIREFIHKFLTDDESNLLYIVSPPYNYIEYEIYEKVSKIINRLNSGYIKFDDMEVFKYKNIISYDKNTNKYYYTGDIMYNDEIELCKNYKRTIYIFNKIKKDLVMKSKELELDEELSQNDIENLIIPFKDEYYVFDKEYVLNKLRLNNLYDACINGEDGFEEKCIISKEAYDVIYNLLVNYGIIWLLLFMHDEFNHEFTHFGLFNTLIFDIVNNMTELISLSKDYKFDIYNFDELVALNKLTSFETLDIAVVGKDMIEILYKNKDYTANYITDIISMVRELLCKMVKRVKSTIPYIEGQTLCYKYSLYDSLDKDILISGINTDACFKVDGNDNDFLHYCALDKNGLIIKITDMYGNFVARAAGFRNGNCVYMNQLRTIYDEDGNNYNGEYISERTEIIEAFNCACKDIVIMSQENTEEKDKIDFVFVNICYSLRGYKSNISDDVRKKIGYNPMDSESVDWDQFVNNTNNLRESVNHNYFNTDYGSYGILCVASVKNVDEIIPEDIKAKDVPALYERKRNKIIVTDNIDEKIYDKIHFISGINSFYENKEYKFFDIPCESIVFIGDNWYIIYNNGNIVNCCLLDFDSKAKIEFEATLELLEEWVLKNNEKINIDILTNKFETLNSKYLVKKLRKS